MVTPEDERVDDLIHEALMSAGGKDDAAHQLLLSALVSHITLHATTPLDRQRRLRAAAQALLAEIHDPEITQV